MPWCPKCKNEYRDGITTCVDCNIPLVDSLEEQDSEIDTCELALIKKKNTAIRLIQYLRYSGISYAAILPDEESQCYQIVVDAQEKKEAMKHYHAFLSVELDHDPEEASDSQSIDAEFEDLPDFPGEEESEDADSFFEDEPEQKDDLKSLKKKSSNATYVSKADSYKENQSSGRMFIGFAILGLAYVALNAFGVLSLINGVFSYAVIIAMFVGFLILGISSLKHAKELSAGIDAENQKTTDIQDYLNSLGDITAYDDADWAGENDEILYFKRTTRLKEMIQEKFGEQDDAYLDSIVEEFYNNTI